MTDPYGPRTIEIDGNELVYQSIEELEAAMESCYKRLLETKGLLADQFSLEISQIIKGYADKLMKLFTLHRSWASDLYQHERETLASLQEELAAALQDLPETIFKRNLL
ncbi:MAG: hypothetical protein ACXIUO_12525 [Erythrobacter sp.]